MRGSIRWRDAPFFPPQDRDGVLVPVEDGGGVALQADLAGSSMPVYGIHWAACAGRARNPAGGTPIIVWSDGNPMP